MLKSIGIIIITAAALGGCSSASTREADTSVYMDPTRPVEERVEALLAQMTLPEKVGQMEMVIVGDKDSILKNGYYDFGAWLADVEPEEANALQKLSEKTRLKIPYLIGMDAAHGHAMLQGRTVYPTSISMAATFNRDLVYRAARQAAGEIRSTGTHWTFAPSVDIVQDARWGRTGETYGEDPYLASELVRCAVHGLQGNLDPQNNVMATVKHLAGGGTSVGGVNHASAEISERMLRSYILPPFQAAIEAGVMSIMPGHNDVDGVPAHASHWLLTDWAKQECGFQGFHISDMSDVENLTGQLHHVAENQQQAVELAVNAGLDMHMYSVDTAQFVSPLLRLVQDGKVPQARIDDAVRRILTAKFRLGLFENRYVQPEQDHYATVENRLLALDAARECVVLLKNEHDLLPLDIKKYRRILVTGPNADNQTILGDWSAFQPDDHVTTILEGIRQQVAGQAEVVYSESGRIKGKKADIVTNTTDPAIQQQRLKEGGAISDYSISDAVRKAARCDLAIVAIGGYGLRQEWGLRTYGESADRPSVDFYGRQVELVKAIAATGIPVIVVIVNGKPLNNPWITTHIPAIVDAWEPGMYGGQAVAEILFGKVNPSGKLPITIPQDAGQIPMYYYQKKSRRYTGYGLGSSRADEKPAFCFGHGLSYTAFEYADLQMPHRCALTDTIRGSFVVRNAGQRAGKETALLFVRDEFSSVTTPVALLKEFYKVDLMPGEETRITFAIPCSRLGLWNQSMKYITEPGDFTLMVGRSVEDIRLQQNITLQ